RVWVIELEISWGGPVGPTAIRESVFRCVSEHDLANIETGNRRPHVSNLIAVGRPRCPNFAEFGAGRQLSDGTSGQVGIQGRHVDVEKLAAIRRVGQPRSVRGPGRRGVY